MTTDTNNLKAVAERLAELCRAGKDRQAVEELYADDVVSIEAMDTPGSDMPREQHGKQAALGKNEWWYANHEVHGGETHGPFLHGDDRFAMMFNFDITDKASGNRMTMQEVGVYTVKDGKIAREEFYYTM